MIYARKPLVVKVLLENIDRKKNITGIYRPSAYIENSGNYFTICKIDNLPKPLEVGDSIVCNAILENPSGYGHSLQNGVLLNLKNGLHTEAKAFVLEILGYVDDLLA